MCIRDSSNKPRYQQWRQEQADALRSRIDDGLPPLERAERLFAVAQIYVTFHLDSSAYYVERLYRLAERTGSRQDVYKRQASICLI